MSDATIKENAPETPSAPQVTPTEPESHAPGKGELLALENAIFRKHIEALTAELAELRSKYNINADPADTLTGEVRELKAMLQNLTAQMQQVQQAQQQHQGTQPMPQPVQWQTAQPQHFGVPYIQTPNYTPLMPATTTLFR
jgi:hypothetical protein